MADKQTYADFIDPQFARYDPLLAKACTDWLYKDPKSNPAYDTPELWGKVHVALVKRTLNFTALAALTGASTQKLSISGGRNAVVLNSRATVKLTTPPLAAAALNIPNVFGSYVTIEQKLTDGFVEITTAPINNVFGTVPGWPDTPPAPALWLGNSDRVITITNAFDAIMEVNLTWLIGIISSGR